MRSEKSNQELRSRRAVLGAVGTAALALSAGCSFGSGGTSDANTSSTTGAQNASTGKTTTGIHSTKKTPDPTVTELTETPRTQSTILGPTVSPTSVELSTVSTTHREPTSATSTVTTTATDTATTTASATTTTTATDTTTPTETTADSLSTTDTDSQTTLSSGSILSGIYADSASTSVTTLSAVSEWLSEDPATAMIYANAFHSHAAIEDFGPRRLTPIWDLGCVPLVTWLPNPPGGDDSDAITREIHSGEYDDYLEDWAQELGSWVDSVAGDGKLYFRPAHEMNGNWFPWSASASDGSPEDYAQMWQHVYDVFMESGLTDDSIQWIWSPNADEIGGVRAEEYYPGDDYVDWVGIDGFNFGDTQWYASWRSPEDVFGSMIDRMGALADKPLGLTEMATSSYLDGEYRPEAKADWIDAAFSMIESNDIKMACWFNVDKTGDDESDWAVFGGQHGTTTYTDEGTEYDVYDIYQDRVRASGVRQTRSDPEGLLSDAEFAGEF